MPQMSSLRAESQLPQNNLETCTRDSKPRKPHVPEALVLKTTGALAHPVKHEVSLILEHWTCAFRWATWSPWSKPSGQTAPKVARRERQEPEVLKPVPHHDSLRV